jgi:hypothetical protein
VWQEGPDDALRGLQGHRRWCSDAVQQRVRTEGLALPDSRKELLMGLLTADEPEASCRHAAGAPSQAHNVWGLGRAMGALG